MALEESRVTGPMLRYRPAPDVPWIRIQFPAQIDPFDLCNFVRSRLFPDVAMVPASMTLTSSGKRVKAGVTRKRRPSRARAFLSQGAD